MTVITDCCNRLTDCDVKWSGTANGAKADMSADQRFIWSFTNLHLSHTTQHTHTHIRLTALFPGLPGWAGTRKNKTNLDFTEARDSEWQWHQLGHMQVCISLQTDNHTSTHCSVFLQARCPSCRPTNSVKACTQTETILIPSAFYSAITPAWDMYPKREWSAFSLPFSRYISVSHSPLGIFLHLFICVVTNKYRLLQVMLQKNSVKALTEPPPCKLTSQIK